MAEKQPLAGTTRSVLVAIVAFWAEHGYSPSMRDIGKAVSRSPSVVFRHIVYLRNDGWIAYDDGIGRSIRVISQTGGLASSVRALGDPNTANWGAGAVYGQQAQK